jgi:hypothetical protein
MAISFEHEIQDDLLVVNASGFDESLRDPMDYGMAVLTIALEHGCRGILCDERHLEYRLGTLDLFDLAGAAAQHVPRTLLVALVPDASGIEDAKFYETVAVNRGVQVRAFIDIDEARRWLDLRTRAIG